MIILHADKRHRPTDWPISSDMNLRPKTPHNAVLWLLANMIQFIIESCHTPTLDDYLEFYAETDEKHIQSRCERSFSGIT